MTTPIRTPKSTVKSSSPPPSTATMKYDNTSCRRDANCTCHLCLASIIATRDLIPLLSSQKSSLTTQFSSLKRSPPPTPIFFDNPSAVSTPVSHASRLNVSPIVATNDLNLKIKRKNKEFGYGLILLQCILVLCLILVGKVGILFVGFRFMNTKLSAEIVRNLSDKSLGLGIHGVKERLEILSSELQNLVPEARFTNPNCQIVQDGLILRYRCWLYKSGIEEVSIWGWPLQTTTGLVNTEFDSRSFTILSGRVTEWSNGELNGSIREANTSWEQGKWSESVWRLDENTWILEYKRSFVFENTRSLSSVMEFLNFVMRSTFQWMKQQLWRSFDGNHITPT
ncbi:uncharacterized protein [Rutidosis leptorrhynchoides]|uniref:uncharacterized protein n=1 Tax=Rutidosis leptorrhynchoides TaxID=125765 RepID=UPI003A9A2EF7